MTDLTFYLGTHRPTWLWTLTDVPLFISHRVLKDRKGAFPKATTPWALDSGGFTELNLFGEWRTTPAEYVASVRRYAAELGGLEWASPQDWMCEPWVVAKTGLSVSEHQARTVENFLILRDMAPDLPFIPVLQGWELADYHAHADAYATAGVDLTVENVVGIGSVCRRQATGQIAGIFDSLVGRGLRMHGFGVKADGLDLYADNLVSADSLAWSYGARRETRYDENGYESKFRYGTPRPCGKSTCVNCLHYALSWRDAITARLAVRQPSLFVGAMA
jgi:hypothetical protein